MSTITVSSVTIPSFRWAIGSGTVYLRIYANAEFVTSAGIPIQSGNPLITGSWYQQLTCSLAGTDLTIPAFTIDSTTDALDINGRSATYSAYFYLGNRQLGLYEGFESFRIVPQYSTNPATWAEIRVDIANAVYVAPSLIDTYDRQTILELIADAVSMSSGVSSINGMMGPAITIAAGTSIGIVSGGNTVTINISGPIAVADGGTSAANAAGARTNLGAAASGANADITSLTGLTTALTSPQGGTGFGTSNPYTVGSVLYASGVTALSQLPPSTAGFVLTTQGAGLAPVWAAASGTIGGAGVAGRASFWSAVSTLSSDAAFLFDSATSRLSVGTAESANTINLGNAGYLSGHGNLAAAQVRIAAIADQTKYTGVASSTQIDAITLGSSVPVAHVYTDGGAAALKPLAPDLQVRANGIRVGYGTAGAYNDSASSNVFHFAAQASNIGSANTVAIFSEAQALGAGSNVWAINPVAYTNVGGTSTATAIMFEGNFGALGVSPNQFAYGIVLASNADVSTPAGTIRSFFQMQANGSSSTVVNGLVISDGSGQAVSNAQIFAQSTTATYAGLFTLSTYATGFDFAGSTFSSGSQIRLANGGAASSGIRAQNNANSANFNVARMTTADYLEYGDGTTGLSGMRFQVSAGSAETLRFLGGATGLPGNAGWNQAAPTAQQHITSIPKRALTDNGGSHSLSITFGSPTLTGTNTDFISDLAPGSTIEISAQAGTYYIVKSVNSITSVTLTSNYGGTNTINSTGKTDYRTLLIEGITGEDWLELSNRHILKLYGNSTYSDLIGMFALVNRATPAKRMVMGVDDTGTYSYISSFQESVGWKPLILQGGASDADTGGVVIGVPTPSVVGAMLKVEGAGIKTADHVGTEFNNIATNASGTDHKKYGAQYLSQGSWQGANTAVFGRSLGASSFSTGHRTNYPGQFIGGAVLIAPDSTQIATPTPVDAPIANLHIYGQPINKLTGTVTVAASTTVNGSGTAFTTELQPGDTIQFGTDTQVYTVKTITSAVVMDLTASYAGTPAAGVTAYGNTSDLYVQNGFGTINFGVRGFNVSVPHLSTLGGTPTTAAGTGAGTTPTLSVTGTDTAGYLNVTTGTAVPASAQTVVTVSFARAYPNSTVPRVVLTPGNALAAALSGNAQVYVDGASSAPASWVVKVGTSGLASSSAYVWVYHVIQ